MKIHQLSAGDAIASLQSDPLGLSAEEAERRLHEHGPNVVQELAREPVWLRFAKEFIQFFSLILWVAAGLAFLAEWSAPGQGMAKIGYAIVIVILVSGLFSFWQEHRVEKTLAALRGLLPQQVKLVRGGRVFLTSAEQVVPGDIVVLEQGDNVPADCRLVEAFDVRVNNAAVTGESLPLLRDVNASADDEPSRAKNILLAGTSLVSGQAKAVVIATGMHTEFGKIAHLTQTAGAAVSPLRQELARLSRLIAFLAILIGLLFFAVGWMAGIPFWKDFIFAIGIIVAMVPEGLLPTLTLSLVLATQRMARRSVLIRYLPSVESLGSTTVICTDKTGTLTENRMTATRLFLGGAVYSPAAIEPGGVLAEAYRNFFLTAELCHDLRETRERGGNAFLGDPMEIALIEMARRILSEPSASRRLDEIPFDAERMRLSTVHAMPAGPTLHCKGALESVLPLCHWTLIDGATRPLDGGLRQQVFAAHERMAEQGLRVLAFAYRLLNSQESRETLERDLVFAGLVGLEDPPRHEVPQALRTCREAGIRVIMVTGDHPHTARAIAREIGLAATENPVVITGEQIRNLSETQLMLTLDIPDVIFARVGADQKRRIVEALKNKNQIVAVTGDGVNDAPALKSAHIGIAMGIAGTDVAKAAADMILLDDNFASIVNAVEEGRAVYENIRKFLTYVLVHNVAELIPYLGFALFRIPLALTPIQVLAVDMGTDSLTSLGLGVERPAPRVMQRPPRPRGEGLMNWPLARRAYLFLGPIEAAAAMAAFFFVLHAGGWKYGQPVASADPLYQQATTACLSAIILMQIVNVFLCRSASRSVFSTGLLGNPLILWGAALEIALVLIIDYTPWGNLLVGTSPLAGPVWLFILPFTAAMLILEELRKWLARLRTAASPSSARDPSREQPELQSDAPKR
ncbi:MAG TPA: cation-transporting P-type ATPase [Burkholderiales bacterium]|nr:cation-transporting P-type ATPase [Burkholderiales bacterium]